MMYQICVSGAAAGKSVKQSKDLAFELGRLVAEGGNALLTGATDGLPYFAAKGALQEKGQSVGISPASSKHEHVNKYRLPIDCFDFILYSGLDYIGRDLLLVRSCDAILSVGGRMGTMHEFAIAVELDKPIGVLTDSGGTTSEMDDVLRAAGRRNSPRIIFEPDPKVLVQKLMIQLDIEHADHKALHKR